MKLTLNNVGVIKECDVEFVPGINLIVGSSGSGKSTLMRCIHNIASNSFSDSDISFGKNKMSIVVESNDNTVEYVRTVNTKDEKCYYKVNNEKYVKLGRQSLPAVTDVLRIGDININGEDINFNFNLQFSLPFLILGSQSTLYNVLTYRNTCDITSINNLYNADIRSNNSEIATNEAVKVRLDNNLASLEKQAESLKPIEQLYSDYILYKHKLGLLNELNNLYNALHNVNTISDKINRIDVITKSISNCMKDYLVINDMTQYMSVTKEYNKVKSVVNVQSKLIENLNHAEKLVDDLSNISKISVITKNKHIIDGRLISLRSAISSSYKLLEKEYLLYDILKHRDFIHKLNACKSVIDVLNTVNSDNSINCITDLIELEELFKSKIAINLNIKNLKAEENKLHKNLSKFDVCPLCGNHLNEA